MEYIKTREILDASDNEDETCEATGYQEVTVCVPVTVTPFAKPGITKTTCCGDPTITPGTATCTGGVENGICTFTITQLLCVEVPIKFGAKADTGNVFTTCGEATDEDICKNCKAE